MLLRLLTVSLLQLSLPQLFSVALLCVHLLGASPLQDVLTLTSALQLASAPPPFTFAPKPVALALLSWILPLSKLVHAIVLPLISLSTQLELTLVTTFLLLACELLQTQFLRLFFFLLRLTHAACALSSLVSVVAYDWIIDHLMVDQCSL